jgi:thioredoxin 1
MIAPAIVELASDFEGQATVGKLNVDEQPGIAEQDGIRSIPTLLFFQDGKVVDQVVGAAPKKALAEKLTRLIPVA